MVELICFDVDTQYKSGRTKSEIIVSNSEEQMWKYYDEHHNKKLIEWSAITDSWYI